MTGAETEPMTAVESYRGELTVYCYRFFAAFADAEDAVQETFVRAWNNRNRFEGRSSLRRWLYAIATNVCLDMAKARQRRSLPMDLHSPGRVPSSTDTEPLPTAAEANWVGPIATHRLSDDPADAAVKNDTVRLAFLAALQTLPPRQRAVLILRDVLAWRASECAEILDCSVASVNSALARARDSLRTQQDARRSRYGETVGVAGDNDVDEQLLNDYVDAFGDYDVDRLVSLLTEDARFSMPPYTLWLQGREDIEQWWRGPGEVCRNSEIVVTSANGQPAVAVYHQGEPFALHVLSARNGRISALTHFMGPRVFAEFGLDR
jgi:RNA polymerase sigma-70 factor (ECF subfamily)